MAAVDPADHRVPRHFRAGDCGCGVLRDQCVFRWQPDQPGCHGDRAGRGGDGHDLHVGPAVGLHINAAVTSGFTARGVFPARWVVPYWVAQFTGAISAALFLQKMFGNVAAGGSSRSPSPAGTGGHSS